MSVQQLAPPPQMTSNEKDRGMDQIKSERNYLAAILDSVADGVFTVDDKMRIVSFNRAAQELTGYTQEEAIGRKCHEVFKTDICLSTCPIRDAFDSGEAVLNREVDIIDKNNRKIPISVSASVLRDSEGEVVGGVETFRDLSLIHILKKELKEKYSFRDLVSRNPVMRKLFDILPDIAASEATVLLNGDSGTGKELFTKAIHDLSPRREGPLVVVNCGAFPEQLLEAEIFGVKRGAYTGAVENRPGRLELAQGGTLFLDEIGDLPLPLQVKLLRVLENKEYMPLGGRQQMKADVRFVTATHRDLEAMVEQGLFRRDLLFRINVLTLKIPPLRERTEDIPLLLDMALERFNKRYGKNVRGYSSEALQKLFRHNYPGNVRELLNIVEQTVILCRNGEISADQLPANFSKPMQESGEVAPAADEVCTQETLTELLERHKGNKSQVARELGVDRTTLWRWMKRREMVPPFET
jgi:PAS domain S-box-containing protein